MPQETVDMHPETFTHAESDMSAMDNALEEQGIDLVEVLTLALREKKTILKFMLVTVALTALVVFSMKPMYTAQAMFIPPQSAPGSGMSQLTSQLGSLGALGALGGIKSPGEVYLGILGSRTIADDLIKRFDLQKVYKIERASDTAKKLKSRSTFLAGKDTLITISVEDHDAKRAADLANGYLDALYEQNGRLALTEASQRRLFFEDQLEREKNALADAEVGLKKTEEQTGLISPIGQAQVVIDGIAQVRAQISSRQIQLSALQQAATDQNPDVIRLQTQIDGLQKQLQRLQNDSVAREPGNVLPSTAKVPALALEYVRKEREVKYHEVLFTLIAKQYESARLDESKEAPLLQVVDRASVPDKKSGPQRLLFIVGAAFVGAFLGMGWILFRQVIAKSQRNPVMAKRLEALRKAAL
jgi:tyrosine-protein kinase Etk/Wzc